MGVHVELTLSAITTTRGHKRVRRLCTAVVKGTVTTLILWTTVRRRVSSIEGFQYLMIVYTMD